MTDAGNDAGADTRYTSGAYLEANPEWHVEDSPWKARQVSDMLKRHSMTPQSVCEVGCGAGEVLTQLQTLLDPTTRFVGYEISPQAFELTRARANERVEFVFADLRDEQDAFFDLMLVLDVIEHLEDPYAFLRAIKPRAKATMLHIPLDMTVQAIARNLVMTSSREPLGHLHYFQKETALATLADAGYEIQDWCYTPSTFAQPPEGARARLIQGLRKAAFRRAPDVTQRLIGGWSLLVLAS